ncbi:MAG: glycoside hydrolase family 88 protein [Proteiniphilum sp.]|nr:glycoside hydrolase family 88 protein [Proteiniphilum sp.]MDD4451572.1 glycoside hydrolase family 88 protein [Proteiniphilum sp.]
MTNKIFGLIGILAICFFISCKTQESGDLIKQNFDFASEQLTYALQEIDSAKLKDERNSLTKAEKPLVSPRTLDENGNLKLVVSRDWTSGFFPGELWYMYEFTKDPEWEKQARSFTASLETQKFTKTTHDLGFMMYCSFGNGLRLTNDQSYKPILLEAANSLISRYKPNAKIIRSWDHNRDKWQCPVIIDNMMNLELLFWASRESGDSTYYNIAVNHANTTIKNHFRPDYGTYHVVDYDTITGEVLNRHTHQGYAHESTWARGEAWALYGYTMCYRETKDNAYLDQARHVADFIFAHPNLPEDLIPYWDFNAPEIPNEPRDVSAAAVIASALYELSTFGGEKAVQYKEQADTILKNLTLQYRATLHEDGGFLLLHSTGSKPSNSEVDVPLVYADYYFLEALLRKDKIENNLSLTEH